MYASNCCFLTCIQVFQEAGKVLWYSCLLKNFPQFVVIHTVKGFGVFNKAQVGVFLELPWFFDDAMDVGNLISVSSAFSKSILNIWKFTVHILLKPGLENFKHYFASVWDECNCLLVWAFFGIAFLWDWNSSSLTIYVKQHNKYRTEPMDDINQSLPSIVSDHSLCPMWCSKCPHAQGCWGLERHIFSVILLVNNKEWIKIEIYLIYTLCPIHCPPGRITASTQAQHGALNMPANLENSAVATGL